MSLNQRIISFYNKRIWIIGASSGIGEACANAFLSHGAKVAISARRNEKLEKIKTRWPNDQCLSITADVQNYETMEMAYKAIENKWGGIDLMLYVAGIYEPMRADNFQLNQAKRMIDTNLIGAMSACSIVLPRMLKNKSGGIAIVGSVAGYSGLPQALAYGPTKAALINYCETLYYDLRPKGLNVYMINPGFVETEATAKNDFEMPALISASQAAEEILDGIQAGQFDIHFPKRFSIFLKFLRLLPYPAYFYLLKKFIKI